MIRRTEFYRRQMKGEVDRMFRMIPKPMISGRPIHAVEIGSKTGPWARRFLENVPDALLWCIDPWYFDEDVGLPENVGCEAADFAKWKATVRPWLEERVFPIRARSWEVADDFDHGPLDLLMLDGDHRAWAVELDLTLWVPKLRPGGLVVGHDWTGAWSDHVRRGVFRWLEKQTSCVKLRTGFLVPSRYECFWFYAPTHV